MDKKQYAFRSLRNQVMEIISLHKLGYKEVFKFPKLRMLKNELINESIKNLEDLDSLIKRVLKIYGHKHFKENIENNKGKQSFNSDYTFSWNEAKLIAEVFAEFVTDEEDCICLKPLMELFLKENDTTHSHNVKREVNEILDKKVTIENTLNYELISRKGELILQDVQENIYKVIQNNRFVFLTGDSGCGKKIHGEFVVNELSNDIFDYKFCLDCEKDEMSYVNLLETILSVYYSDDRYSNLKNNIPELKRKVQECLSNNINFILYINGFDNFSEVDKRNVIGFIENNVAKKNIVIITSNIRMNNYEYISNLFQEVVVRKYRLEEWRRLAAIYKQRNEMLRNIADFRFAKLVDLAYENGNKTPGRMLRYLFYFCDQIVNADLYDYHVESSKILFGELFKELSDISLSALVSLSFFQKPVSMEHLVSISGLSDSQLSQNLIPLKKKLLIKEEKSEIDANVTLYALPNKLKAAIEEEKQKHREKYEQIILDWLLCYSNFTSMDKPSDAEIISELKLDSTNLGYILAYCEDNDRWGDFGMVSQLIC